jgi:uncharacterized protein (DUF1697 family)
VPRLIAFLRAINVGGHTVTMKQLRDEFGALGLRDAETFIASGNVIFSSRSKDMAALERRIEKRLLDCLGYEVRTFLRSDAQVAAIAARQPFTAARFRSAGAFCVGFLPQRLDAANTRTLMTLRTGIDDFHVEGSEVYWLCQNRQGESTFSNAVFERLLKLRATWRGMNTLTRLTAKYRWSTHD